MYVVIVAKYHDQPPIDTPAKITENTKVIEHENLNTPIGDIVQQALSNQKRFNTLIELKILWEQ